MQDRIREVLSAHGRMPVDPRGVDSDDDLYKLGLTSHASVNVMLALEDEFDIEFPDEALKRSTFASVSNIHRCRQSLRNTRVSLAVLAEPDTYSPHFTHSPDRIWPETNCYFDLWIELLHSLGLDPVPSFACTLSADHDGLHWSFIKPPPEDIRRLYGLEVTEENVWMSVLETVESGPPRGVLHTVEVDSWWLPDTAGTAYRSEHVKTTILPTRVDRHRKLLWYLHNAGLYALDGEDFDRIFSFGDGIGPALPPYIEQIRSFPAAESRTR